ncbi:uncharacterized protein LOC125178345 [Hyalella azteca]|uniref:Uncharacterized protein LOC125178345 n=1 Tax=Hyalella azteca TaxID=294128 RepID=A0A979FMD1_HYAAZ|nr:uncharacterized protein LOC125178345 [Hyalella azteca]
MGCDLFEVDNGVCTIYGAAVPPSLRTHRYEALGGHGSFERARGKTATSSSYYDPLNSTRAVDGDNTTVFHSLDTYSIDQPWLLIDLISCVRVEKIRVLPYTLLPNQVERFVDIQFLGGVNPPPSPGDFSAYTVLAYYAGPPALGSLQWIEFNLASPVCSRYVAVNKRAQHPYPFYLLVIVELEIWTSY